MEEEREERRKEEGRRLAELGGLDRSSIFLTLIGRLTKGPALQRTTIYFLYDSYNWIKKRSEISSFGAILKKRSP